jgi:hypothetical protein
MMTLLCTRLVQRFGQGIPRQQFQPMALLFAPRPEGAHQRFAVLRPVSELVVPGELSGSDDLLMAVQTDTSPPLVVCG